MSQDREPQFSETERTPAQRWDTVQFALGVSASAGGQASAESVQLYERYILGEIDLEHVGAAVRQLYPQYPSNDPHAGRWTPTLDAEPARPLEAPPGYEHDPAEEPHAEPEQPADVYVARLRAYVQEIADYVATLPPRQRYIYFDDTQQVSL
jgi:hypothetical protein